MNLLYASSGADAEETALLADEIKSAAAAPGGQK